MRIRVIRLALLFLTCMTLHAHADPLARPGDMLLRHDIRLLVDEGVITLLQNSTTLAILRDVEECNFLIDGRILRIRLRVARADANRRVYRAFLEKRFYLRNN